MNFLNNPVSGEQTCYTTVQMRTDLVEEKLPGDGLTVQVTQVLR